MPHTDFESFFLLFFARKNEMQTVKLEKLSAVDLLLRNVHKRHIEITHKSEKIVHKAKYIWKVKKKKNVYACPPTAAPEKNETAKPAQVFLFLL